jgi:hypothetical protein
MIVLHAITTEKDVIVPKDEFKKLVENYRKFESIEVQEEYDPDYLTEENLKARQEAMKELERGEAISFEDWKKELRKREEEESLFVVRHQGCKTSVSGV